MKKFTLLFAMVALLVSGNLFAQTVLIQDSFEEYTVGNKVGTESAAAGHDWWTTWSNAPGGAEDAVVSDAQASDGTKSMYASYGNDQVLLLGNKTSGVYSVSLDVFIPTGKDAYCNLLHIFNGTGSEWACEIYMKSASEGTVIKANNISTSFEVPFDTWFTLHFDVDLDSDTFVFTANGTEVYNGQFSMQAGGGAGTRQLAAMDIFPPTSAAVSSFYVDNVNFTQVGGESTSSMSVTPESISAELNPDDMGTATLTIDNSGTAIGDWYGYIDFGEGPAGTQSTDLYYYSGDYSSGIGSASAFLREIANKYPAASYAGASMGMQIVSAQYYIGTYTATDHIYTFRIYGQGFNGQPGEMLAEKAITSTATSSWITCTFDTPVYMTGQDMWLAVEMQQTAGEYPLSTDAGPAVGNGDWLRSNGGTWERLLISSGGQLSYNWMLSAHCVGTLVNGSWATLGATEGAVLGGQTSDVTISLSSIGLSEGDVKQADIHVFTNDEEHPSFLIPLTLHVGITAVNENENTLCSVYPNPASSTITLQGENLSSVAVYNVAGQLVRIVKLDNVVNNINLDVEAGIYFLSVYDNAGNNSVSRLVVK